MYDKECSDLDLSLCIDEQEGEIHYAVLKKVKKVLEESFENLSNIKLYLFSQGTILEFDLNNLHIEILVNRFLEIMNG